MEQSKLKYILIFAHVPWSASDDKETDIKFGSYSDIFFLSFIGLCLWGRWYEKLNNIHEKKQAPNLRFGIILDSA